MWFSSLLFDCLQRKHEHNVVTHRHKLKVLEYSFGLEHIEYSSVKPERLRDDNGGVVRAPHDSRLISSSESQNRIAY